MRIFYLSSLEDISFILLGGYFIYPPWRIFHLSSLEDISFILLGGYLIYPPWRIFYLSSVEDILFILQGGYFSFLLEDNSSFILLEDELLYFRFIIGGYFNIKGLFTNNGMEVQKKIKHNLLDYICL